MEALLHQLLPRLVPGVIFQVHPFNGKQSLLKRLEERLRAYARWMSEDYRIFVIVDRDNEDCRALKRKLEELAATAGLVSRSAARGGRWQVVNRIAIEELEAWYFGDWRAVTEAFDRVSGDTPRRAPYRKSDEISGGTAEAFERILKGRGYFPEGLRKIEAVRSIGAYMDPGRNTSPSFIVFRDAVIEATI